MSEAAVLLVDDDAPIRRMLERTLAAEGYDVAAAADGGAALAQVERSLPDVIVLDVAMPGMDGLAVTRRLRAKGLRVPILLLTARDALHERVAGLDAGADDYLVKPFEVDELTARDPRAAAPQPAARRAARVRRPRARAGDRSRRAAAAATSSSRAARPSCSSCCCATPAASSPASWRSSASWGEGEASANVVDRYVAYLRRKLGDPPLIHTVRGVGFRLE